MHIEDFNQKREQIRRDVDSSTEKAADITSKATLTSESKSGLIDVFFGAVSVSVVRHRLKLLCDDNRLDEYFRLPRDRCSDFLNADGQLSDAYLAGDQENSGAAVGLVEQRLPEVLDGAFQPTFGSLKTDLCRRALNQLLVR
jgi:hypothetical protein